MEKELKIIILRESLIQSVITDAFTFGFLIFTTWFNYAFIGGSQYVYAIILVMFIMFLMQTSRVKKFYSKKDAIKYIEE